MSKIQRGLIVTAILCGVVFTSQQSNADSTKDAARDARGNFVTTKNGDCVRTRWSDSTDPCAPPAPAPAPVVVEEKKVEVVSAKTLQQEQRTLYFDFNKADLTPDSINKLNNMADLLKADKNVKDAKIVGYADRIGSDEYNEKLSKKRAKAVQDYLTSRGYLNANSTEVRWLGESVPVTKCDPKLKRPEAIKCLAHDRRVEVEINYYTESTTK